MNVHNINIYTIKRKLSYLLFRPFQKLAFGKIGNKSFIYKPVLLTGKRNIFLGENVFFREGARIEVFEWYNGAKYISKLKIGNNVSFENNVQISCVGNVIIGDNCVFSLRSTILSEMHSYDDIGVNCLNTKLKHSDVIIGSNCFFGADTKIFPGSIIGNKKHLFCNCV